MTISVVMASLNGEAFIESQIESILECLSDRDQLVISDDGSTDLTLSIAGRIAGRDRRILLVPGPSRGVIANFEHALGCCNGDIVFLADQDDVWLPDKVSRVLPAFDDPNVMCVVHDVAVVDSNLKLIAHSYFGLRRSGPGLLKNWAKVTYLGAAMAFRASLLDRVLPIPKRATMHDQWIGVVSEVSGACVFLPEVLSLYRRHDHNVTALNRSGGAISIIQKRFWTAGLIIGELLRGRKGTAPARLRDLPHLGR